MRLIKRYSNRKLYDTSTRNYVTLENIAALVVEGEEIKVVDNDNDEDLTTVILSQILLERERSKRSLSSSLLSGLLRSGENIGRNLSNLTRPVAGSAGLLGILESEVDRSFKFWAELSEGREEELLRLMERGIERRRKNRANRRGLDNFLEWQAETRYQTKAETAQLKIIEIELGAEKPEILAASTTERVLAVTFGKLHLTLNGVSSEIKEGETVILPPTVAPRLASNENCRLLLIQPNQPA